MYFDQNGCLVRNLKIIHKTAKLVKCDECVNHLNRKANYGSISKLFMKWSNIFNAYNVTKRLVTEQVLDCTLFKLMRTKRL